MQDLNTRDKPLYSSLALGNKALLFSPLRYEGSCVGASFQSKAVKKTGVISRIDYPLLVIGENPEQQKDSDSSTPPTDSESNKSANL